MLIIETILFTSYNFRIGHVLIFIKHFYYFIFATQGK
jgi:hypothetical protein